MPRLPEIEDEQELLHDHKLGSNFRLMTAYDHCIGLYNELNQLHFELLLLAYGAYLTFFQFCQAAFPDMGTQVMTQMIAGYDTTMFRPGRRAQGARRAAIAHGVDGSFADGRAPARGAGGAGAERREAGPGSPTSSRASTRGSSCRRATASTTTTAPGPTTSGCPFTAITGYIAQIHAGTSLDRPKERLLAERDRIADGVRAAARHADEERTSFEEMLGLCRHVFPHAEGHKFFIEHWGTSLFFNKMREIGAVMAENGFFESADDVFYLNIHEVHEALSDLGLAWSGGAAARGTVYWPPRVERRKEILGAALAVDAAAGARRRARGHQRPDGAAALGRHRRPAARLGRARPRARASRATRPRRASSRASRASSATSTRSARCSRTRCSSAPVTAPSWGPVFPKIAAAVSDIGGMMSHAAIVAREYGLPAVVGTGHATKLIKTGDRVRVDGDNGTVTILS